MSREDFTTVKGEIDFACSCGKEGKEHEEEVYQQVFDILNAGTKEMISGWVTEKSFVTSLIWSLNWDYDVSIESVHNDMWFGIAAEHYDYEKKIITKYYVRCDSVEYGLCELYLHMKELVK